MIEWDWRLEDERQIVCGSSNSRPTIQTHLANLLGLTLTELLIQGAVPELTIGFSNGLRLRSMAMVSGDPQWGIKLPDDIWLQCRSGTLARTNSTEEPADFLPEELAAMEFAETTSKRWGRPIEEPAGGCCRDCKFFVRIDGHFELLDYGVCGSAESRFDGHATSTRSGCPKFTALPA
jgi:hypothetical protein